MTSEEIFLGALILIAATLYSSVGHAGASGYLASMALFGLAPEIMRPTALALNVLVASLATYRYTRAGQNDIKLLLPFAFSSIPAAFLGGMIHVPASFYKTLIGILLLLSAFQLLRTATKSQQQDQQVKNPGIFASLATGAGLGFFAGLSGTGGGIFLSPLLIFMGWAPTRKVSGIAASFILVNSISGLLGNVSSINSLPSSLPFWAIAALLGGLLGTHLGTRKLTIPGIRVILAVVLLVASLKMFFR